MTKDEALKLALEALELEDMACRYEKDPTPEHIAKTITAIREALALSVSSTQCEETPHAQPVQEPVAWMHPDGRVWTFGRGLDKSTFTIPLYTTPPHRKPLTDEEIEAIHQSTWMQSTATLNDFARAIEAAHGIKE